MASQLETICLTNLERFLDAAGTSHPTIVGRTTFQERLSRLWSRMDDASRRGAFGGLAANSHGFATGFNAHVLPMLFHVAAEAEGLDSVPCETERGHLRQLFADYRHSYMSNLFLTTRYFARKFFSSIDLAHPSLEIGTEDGVTTQIVFGKRRLTVGGNPSMPELLDARKRGVCREYLSLDAMQLPFAENVFQTCVLMYTFYHIEDRAKALREMHRVLAPGGVVAFVDSTACLETNFPVTNLLRMLGFDNLADEMKAQWFSRYDGNRRTITLDEYPSCLDQMGFDVVAIEPFMSRRVTAYAYFAYLFDNIFQSESFARLASPSSDALLLESIEKILAPMLAKDAAWCAAEGNASMLFVVARKKGASSVAVPERDVLRYLRCPVDGTPLERTGNVYRSNAGTEYPIVHDIPLLVPCYAQWWRNRRGAQSRTVA